MKSKPSIKNVTCRLYPTKEQEELLNKYCGAHSMLYSTYVGTKFSMKTGYDMEKERDETFNDLTSILAMKD